MCQDNTLPTSHHPYPRKTQLGRGDGNNSSSEQAVPEPLLSLSIPSASSSNPAAIPAPGIKSQPLPTFRAEPERAQAPDPEELSAPWSSAGSQLFLPLDGPGNPPEPEFQAHGCSRLWERPGRSRPSLTCQDEDSDQDEEHEEVKSHHGIFQRRHGAHPAAAASRGLHPAAGICGIERDTGRRRPWNAAGSSPRGWGGAGEGGSIPGSVQGKVGWVWSNLG